MKGLLQVAKLW